MRQVRRECVCCAAPLSPRARQHVFDVHAYACVCMCRGRQWHPAARMRACMMQREQQGSPRARAGPGRVMHAHTCTDVRATVGCAHGYLGCLHAWHVCVSPAPSVCRVYGRKEQGHTHTHTCGSPLLRICYMCHACITPQSLRSSSLPSSCVAPYVCVHTALSFMCAVFTCVYVQSERGSAVGV